MSQKKYLIIILIIFILMFFAVSCNLIFPNKPPEITSINVPAEVIEGNNFECEVVAFDDKGINYYSVEFDSIKASNTTGVFNLQAPDVSSDETKKGTVTVYDNMGYKATENFYIIVLESSTAPSVKIVTPSEGSQISLGSTFEITANATNVDKVEFYFDSQKISEKNSKPYSTTYNAITASDHTIKVVGYKGSIKVQDQVNISIVENTPPSATITLSPVVEVGEEMLITLDAQDENGIDSSTLTIITPTNKSYYVNFSSFPKIYSFEPDELGIHQVRFEVMDSYNNSTVKSKDFISTDTRAPDLTLNFPKFNNRSEVSIEWVIDDPSTWNGVMNVDSVTFTSNNKIGSFSQNVSINLNDGINQVTLCATDLWGHTSTKLATLVVDTVTPSVELNIPDLTLTNSLNFVYTASDEWFEYATLYVMDSQIPLNEATDQNFNVSIQEIDGESLIATLVVEDKAGNVSIATDNTYVDNTLYFIDATYPATTDQKSADITVIAEDKNLDENYLALNVSSNISSYSVSKNVQTANGRKRAEINLSLNFADTDSVENVNIGIKDTYGNTRNLNLEITVDNIKQPPQPLNSDLYVNTQIGRIDYALIKFHEKVDFDENTTAVMEYKSGSSVYSINNTAPLELYGDEQTVMIKFGELIPSDVSAATITINGLADLFGNELSDPVTVDQIHLINTSPSK
ncbi:MAG: large repetitive protein [Thermotogaceae bacterium]|nr:large repetitive protein [Thermotogaceae bacterium]MDN5337273.1 large repetitive protein [Thermotogaceae bacterium]